LKPTDPFALLNNKHYYRVRMLQNCSI